MVQSKQELLDALVVPLAKRLYSDSLVARQFAADHGFKVEVTADNVVKVNDRDGHPLLVAYLRWEEYCPELHAELPTATVKELKRLAQAVKLGDPLRACWLWQGTELYSLVGAIRQAEADVRRAKELDRRASVLELKAQELLDDAAMLRAEASKLYRGAE